jgi:UDP-glucose 4-epimerase
VNVLVVGGAGFIGSHLVERLLAEGHAVDVVDDLSTGSLANLGEARHLGGELKIHTLDATTDEFAALVALREPEVIYHLACLPPGSDAARAGASGIASVLTVLEAARHLGGVKVVVPVSAVVLYGDVSSKDLPIKEGVPWSPVGLRGVLSRSVIDLLGVYREQHDVEFTVLALGNVYGARQRPEAGVVAAFAANLQQRVSPMVHGDGRQTRDFVYIDDAVDAFVRAADRGGGLVVNIGTGVGTSIRDLWSLMAGPDGRAPSPSPRRAHDVARCALSPTRARIHLAWASWTELAVGLRFVRG